jgi:hypothetical protein
MAPMSAFHGANQNLVNTTIPLDLLMYSAKLLRMNGEEEKVRWVALVRQQIEKTDYGVIQIVIHNSRVVRIERTEKLLVADRNHDTTGGDDER